MVRRDIKAEADAAIAKGIVSSRWEYIHGTTHQNNLPDHKKHLHEGHCWCPCPFDTSDRCSDTRKLQLLGTTNPPEGIVVHVVDGKEYYMKTSSRGPEWGFECTFPGCPYYGTHGQIYFYT